MQKSQGVKGGGSGVKQERKGEQEVHSDHAVG